MFLFVSLFMFCLLPLSASCAIQKQDNDSLTATIKKAIPPSKAGKEVYKDSDYYKDIPVEKVHSAVDTSIIVQAFQQMDKKYQSGDFNYEDNRVNRLSWWDRLKRNVKEFLISLAPHFRFNLKKIFYYVLIGIGILVLAYVIYRLILNGKKPLYKDDLDHTPPPDWIEENLMEINLNSHFEQALSQKNYRHAIRFLHLINLKTLAQSEQIEWNVQKTNHDFLREIKNMESQQIFSTTIVVYEYTWYGGFTISEAQFQEYRQLFIAFKEQIQQKRKTIIA